MRTLEGGWHKSTLAQEIRNLVAERLGAKSPDEVARHLEISVMPMRELLLDGRTDHIGDELLRRLAILLRCETDYFIGIRQREGGVQREEELPPLTAWGKRNNNRIEHARLLARNRRNSKKRRADDEQRSDVAAE